MSINTEAPMRILVIDDSENSRDLTEGALLSAGYTDIVTASSGWEALKIFDVGRDTRRQADHRCCLLDIVMPEMDGVEACARIRNDPRYADLPIIMVTALDDMNSLSNAFVAGATDYVTKPVNRVELVARVRAALRLKQELDRRQARERELLTFVSNWGDRRASSLIDESDRPVRRRSGGGLSDGRLRARDRRGDFDPRAHARSFRRLPFGQRRRPPRATCSRRWRARCAGSPAPSVSWRRPIATAPSFSSRPEPERSRRASSARRCARRYRSCACANSESVVSDYVTASVAAITGRVKHAIDRVQLLTQAISRVQDAASAGGDRVVALTI